MGRRLRGHSVIPNREMAEILKLQGWFTGAEGNALANLAAKVPVDQEIVELGAFAGRSTAFLAHGSKHGRKAHVTSIDPWGPGALPGGTEQDAADEVLESYRQTLTELDMWRWVTPLRAMGEHVAPMWQKSIGLLFLDATHLYEDTRDEMERWAPLLAPRAFAAFHDYHPHHDGVVKALDEAEAAGRWVFHTQVGSLRILRLGS